MIVALPSAQNRGMASIHAGVICYLVDSYVR
jgi:hypothetical protein